MKEIFKADDRDILAKTKVLTVTPRVLWELLVAKVDFKKYGIEEDVVPLRMYYDVTRCIIGIEVCSPKFPERGLGMPSPEIHLRTVRKEIEGKSRITVYKETNGKMKVCKKGGVK